MTSYNKPSTSTSHLPTFSDLDEYDKNDMTVFPLDPWTKRVQARMYSSPSQFDLYLQSERSFHARKVDLLCNHIIDKLKSTNISHCPNSGPCQSYSENVETYEAHKSAQENMDSYESTFPPLKGIEPPREFTDEDLREMYFSRKALTRAVKKAKATPSIYHANKPVDHDLQLHLRSHNCNPLTIPNLTNDQLIPLSLMSEYQNINARFELPLTPTYFLRIDDDWDLNTLAKLIKCYAQQKHWKTNKMIYWLQRALRSMPDETLYLAYKKMREFQLYVTDFDKTISHLTYFLVGKYLSPNVFTYLRGNCLCDYCKFLTEHQVILYRTGRREDQFKALEDMHRKYSKFPTREMA